MTTKTANNYRAIALQQLEMARDFYNRPWPIWIPAGMEVRWVRYYAKEAGISLAEIGTSEKELKKLEQWPRHTFLERFKNLLESFHPRYWIWIPEP